MGEPRGRYKSDNERVSNYIPLRVDNATLRILAILEEQNGESRAAVIRRLIHEESKRRHIVIHLL